jgi:hypothetical protein
MAPLLREQRGRVVELFGLEKFVPEDVDRNGGVTFEDLRAHRVGR